MCIATKCQYHKLHKVTYLKIIIDNNTQSIPNQLVPTTVPTTRQIYVSNRHEATNKACTEQHQHSNDII